MWLLAYTLNHEPNGMEDVFTIHGSEAEARAAYDAALGLDNLSCAAVAKIVEATEPHWMEGE